MTPEDRHDALVLGVRKLAETIQTEIAIRAGGIAWDVSLHQMPLGRELKTDDEQREWAKNALTNAVNRLRSPEPPARWGNAPPFALETQNALSAWLARFESDNHVTVIADLYLNEATCRLDTMIQWCEAHGYPVARRLQNQWNEILGLAVSSTTSDAALSGIAPPSADGKGRRSNPVAPALIPPVPLKDENGKLCEWSEPMTALEAVRRLMSNKEIKDYRRHKPILERYGWLKEPVPSKQGRLRLDLMDKETRIRATNPL